jgi:undecaprenyl-diphosphatase
MKRTLILATGFAALLAVVACACPSVLWAAGAPPDSLSFEVRAFRLLNRSIENGAFDAAMPVASDFGKFRIAVILVWCALVLFGKTRGRWAALMLIPIIAASDQLSSHLIKPLFERVRPCDAIGSVHLWMGKEGWITTPAVVARSYKPSYSFPSSHAANITASMLFLGLVYRRWIVPLLAIAAVVSLSRIYVGVHWPSDVAAGAALGALIASLAYAIFARVYRVVTRPEPDTPPSE